MSTRQQRIAALCVAWVVCLGLNSFAKETFTPYKAGEVPQNAKDIWKDYDPRSEGLDVKVIKEWKEGGVVTRYITFKVGTFKGADSQIAAFYSFPDNGKKNPAFVWSHGGGQRAEKERGIYFAKHGFATVDINWNGRPMEKGIDENTDWGKVDATQGPKFYPKALRNQWKNDLKPDRYSIDPVPSPRNVNYFLVSLAGRRAITFLEQQPEVDAEKIGFAGFSMGGMVTALTSIDPRLKAVAPFVGGTGFRYVDFPGGLGGGDANGKDDLYIKTVDASSYWPLVKCPVMFITSSNDFNAAFERVYQSMALLNHKLWRVTANMHESHGPGPEQWVLLNMWFDQYLKGVDENIPIIPPSTFTANGDKATFTVTPADQKRLLNTEIYYSYDPNPRTRFWKRADANRSGETWSVDLTVHNQLPLYVFALCRYKLDKKVPTLKGEASAFTLNSLEQVHMPDQVDRKALAKLDKSQTVFEDFKNGLQDWSAKGNTIRTYKFQSPDFDFFNKDLSFTIDPQGKDLALRLTAESRFLEAGSGRGSFSFVKSIRGTGLREVIIRTSDFKSKDRKKLEWTGISRFSVLLIDENTKDGIDLTSKEGQQILKLIKLLPVKNEIKKNAGKDSAENLAPLAAVSGPGIEPRAAVDGVKHKDGAGEWIGDSPNAWYGWIKYPQLELKWEKPQKVNKVVIYDRPTLTEHMAAAVLKFSDGPEEHVFAVPNDGSPRTVVFEPRETTWMRLESVDGIGTQIGLSEVEVYYDPLAKPETKRTKKYTDFVSYVDPTIETGRGRWFFCTPGSRPFGMVCASAYTRNKNQGGGGYNYNSNEILGFANIHAWIMSGINIMPTTGKLNPNLGEKEWKSSFSHDTETIEPGYHRLFLDRYKIQVEYTSTDRVAFYRLKYHQAAKAKLLLQLGGFVGAAGYVDGKAKFVSPTRIEGSHGMTDRLWGGPKLSYVFYVMELDRP
ncbi:MAG: dienelactone hydrolase family protein, partial [Planctomycetes bacterium]|nr:dienelactone hydrolase family protein [Planctomycetota bacterium]